ncbi:MAG: PIG-L family deacetylase [Bryobacteraceae bacterium]|nr:PIG-L family deacetylase [Bryobacteraceae bacterium]
MRTGLFLASLSLAFVPASVAVAQVQPTAINEGAAGAWRSLLRLRTTATVLHTTAHPDDEDGAMLVWLTRDQGARTGLLTLNRGEGGANFIGSELFDALGMVRTEELLASGRYYGVDQFFTRVADFGFSKRLDETLEHWGKENVLRDVVRVVRLYRPDILISRFHGKPRDGHGNHQTAGLMSHEVFEAAADPAKFPELNLPPWQIKKLYLSVRENEPHTLTVDVGAYDPLLGMSYRQAAGTGLSYQRSQGAGGRRADAGPALSAWQLAKTALPKAEREQSVFDGIDTSIRGLAKLAPPLDLDGDLGRAQDAVDRALRYFDARAPWRVVESDIVPGLRAIRSALAKARQGNAPGELIFRLSNKEREFQTAVNRLLGISLEALVDPPRGPEGMPEFFRARETFAVAIPGQQFSITAAAVNRGDVRIEPSSITLQAPPGWRIAAAGPPNLKPLGFNQVAKAQFQVAVPDDAAFTRPYWSRKSEYRDHLYEIARPEHWNMPHSPPEVMAEMAYRVGGEAVTVRTPAKTVYRSGAYGEQRRNLTVAPAMSVAITPEIGVIPAGRRAEPLTVRVRAMSNVKGPAAARLRLELPPGWTSAPASADASFTHEGEVQNVEFRVTAPPAEAGKSYTLAAIAEYAGRQYREGYQIIAHRDLETRHLYRPATASWSGIDVKVAPGLKVGYIMGVGDEIPEALEQIGVKVQMLTGQDLATGNLSQFDTILVGIRASAVREDYKTYNKRLLDYVQAGGNLIVQYQTQEFDAVPYGPYPFKLGRRAEEVSEEDAKITILDPANPIFAGPNRITPADFEGWVEERGSKFMSEWDPKYKPLLECHDRGQAEQKGGLLQAGYGKGTFTYSAYAFYRQLPAGVPGAYRLFANMISLGKASGKARVQVGGNE